MIRGETPHFDFVAGECARGIMDVQLATGMPIGFGVLTTGTLEQAGNAPIRAAATRATAPALAAAALGAL